jgi:membrane protein involved in colicin uptake
VTQERERAAAAAAAIAARATRLVAMELAAARAEVEEAEAAAELEALRGSSVGSSVSGDGSTNDELRLARKAAQEQAAQWAAVHPHGDVRDDSLDRRRRADGAPGENARGCSPDGRGRADGAPGGGGRVDGDRGLYKRRSSPSPNRYHGHRGVQAVVRDIGPDGGWPTLTKTNYVEWAVVMRVRLQIHHMWEAVRYGDVDYYED